MGQRGPLTRAAEQIKEDDAPVLIPQPGVELDPLVLEEWEDFWQSKVSRFTDDVDIDTLRRLFIYRNEWVQLAREWALLPADERVTEGSRNSGAVRLHPFASRMDKLESMMLPLEDRFGLSPLSRARLGIEVGSLHLTWRQLQQTETAKAVDAGAVPSGLPVGGAEVYDADVV